MQYNCSIIAQSLNEDSQINLLCDTKCMIRRHLVRGYNDQVFFAESSGSTDKIYSVQMNPESPGTVIK